MKSDWMECVRWCHRADSPESVEKLIEAFADHCIRSGYSNPLLTTSKSTKNVRAAGYALLYPGALASLGNLSLEANEDDVRGQQLMVEVAKELFQLAFEQGVELVQAISPLIASRLSAQGEPSFISPHPLRDEVLKASGMIPVAKLVQMEAVDLYAIPKADDSSELLEGNRLEFVSHHLFPSEQWCDVIERTYVETRDVPELNGLRRMASTLEGYASSTQGVPDSWWMVQCNGLDVGCLLLTRTANECCELTYCGLVPEWRGKGLSKSIMNYVREWALDNWIQGITLAVDLRNLPAIRLYQSRGFVTQGFVQAWILPRMTVNSHDENKPRMNTDFHG